MLYINIDVYLSNICCRLMGWGRFHPISPGGEMVARGKAIFKN